MGIVSIRQILAAHSGILILITTSNHPSEQSQRGNDGLSQPGEILRDFIKSSQPWSREGIPLPRRLRFTLVSMIPLELLWGIWLMSIVSGATPCDGPIYTVATLNQHATALLACDVFSFVGLTALVPITRGFAKCNDIEIVGLTIASAAGGVALLGITALLIAAAIVLILLATFVLALTATSRREIDDARPRTPFPIAVPRYGDDTRARRAEPAS
jgi:hypothetical protein